MSLSSLYLLYKDEQKERNKRDEERHKCYQRLRILRDRFNKHSIPDKEFEFKYRLSKDLFVKLREELTPLLPPNNHVLDNGMKILLALNFFAWGRYQGSVAHKFNISYKMVSQCINEVTEALNNQNFYKKYVKFPQNKEERDDIKKYFELKFGIPDVIGCITCTHIPIIKPSAKEECYLNSIEYYSFTAQLICDAYGSILNADATYGGASQETDIWYGHPIEKQLYDLQETAYLLGNTMYLQEKHLMVPIVEDDPLPEDSPKSRYNAFHEKVYSTTMSLLLSQLKARWRCLLAWKELHYEHRMAAKIFYACCVLHNWCNASMVGGPLLSETELERERERQYESDFYPEGYLAEEVEEARNKLVQLLEEKRICQNKVNGKGET